MLTLKTKSYYLALVLLLSVTVNAQQLTLSTGSNWEDALLLHSYKPSESYMATNNYNNYPRISAAQWTHSGYRITYRSLMRFELSTIPQGAVVQSATLYMNSDPAYTSGELSNSTLSGSNAIYFERVTSPWDPATVTWNTQPSTTTTNRVWAGPSTSATQNIQTDLTSHILILPRMIYRVGARSNNYRLRGTNIPIHLYPLLYLSFVHLRSNSSRHNYRCTNHVNRLPCSI